MIHLHKPSTTLFRSRLICHSTGKLFKSSYSNTASITLPPTPPETGYCLLPNRRLLTISGPDSTRYLQGAITANVNSNTSTGFYTVFLNAQGRILNDVFIYPIEEDEKNKGQQGWLIEVDAKQVEILAKRINRYKLRSKFEVRILPVTERVVWSIWDDTEEKLCAASIPSILEKGIGCLDRRVPKMGLRLTLPADKKPELNMRESHHDCYRIRRYLRGVPEGQDELIPEHAFPHESNIDFMGGIDFRKGCYVGQELTIRTHHTGVVRKRILPMQLYGLNQEEPKILAYSSNLNFGAESIPTGSNITPWGRSGRNVGKWLTGIGNIGLGLCRMTAMTNIVRDEIATYHPGDEFKLEWKSEDSLKTVKVRAVGPFWWPTKADDQ